MKYMWSNFWSAHQRFFKCLSIAVKVDLCVRIAKEEIEKGNCVVIGLQATGDAQTQAELGRDNNISSFISTAK